MQHSRAGAQSRAPPCDPAFCSLICFTKRSFSRGSAASLGHSSRPADRDLGSVDMENKAYWDEGVALPNFEPLSHDIETDVTVVGGGLTGITAAYLLKKAGVKVVLLERQQCARADTGC